MRSEDELKSLADRLPRLPPTCALVILGAGRGSRRSTPGENVAASGMFTGRDSALCASYYHGQSELGAIAPMALLERG